MIKRLDGFPDNVVAVACLGQVSRHDYETVLIPTVDAALKRHDKVRIYYEIGAGFEGIDAGAMWEDMKVGVTHLRHWERIALVTDVAWIANTMKAFAFMIPGEIKVFPVSATEAARAWIVA